MLDAPQYGRDHAVAAAVTPLTAPPALRHVHWASLPSCVLHNGTARIVEATRGAAAKMVFSPPG